MGTYLQHFVVGFHGFTPSDDIKVLIREYHVGNVILMKRNIQSKLYIRRSERRLTFGQARRRRDGSWRICRRSHARRARNGRCSSGSTRRTVGVQVIPAFKSHFAMQVWSPRSAQRRPGQLCMAYHHCFKLNAPLTQRRSPGAMALAATGSPDLAERVGGASAAELKAVGINWVYSPVADVNTDSRNPVIGKCVALFGASADYNE